MRQGLAFAASLGGIAVITALYRALAITNATTVAMSFLLVVLLAAAFSHLWVAISTSVVAMVSFNYFFLPPVGTLTIADPQNWVALVAFLAVSLVASNLSSTVRSREREARERRDELARLFDLSREVMLITDSREAVATLARAVSRRFDLDYAAICLPRQSDWEVYEAGALTVDIDRPQLSTALTSATNTLEFDARTRTYGGHRRTTMGGVEVQLVPLRVGTRVTGLLATAGRPVEPGTLDALAGVAAIAIERVQFLDERKAADLARQSEALKSALLASLGHDLRTPLTAIRVAATNLRASWPTESEREAQSALILVEVERLNRLFQNILDMAKLDAGGMSAERRWVHPSEVVEAARAQVEHLLKGHPVNVRAEGDSLAKLDPRLTAAALGHLLENAAEYSPAGSPVDVEATVDGGGLRISVRDHGPGIAPQDLPRLFERFYRGVEGQHRTSGTGMGLSIARGVLAVEQGRVWAENCVDGGARLTIVVPADTKPQGTAAEDAS